MLFFLLDLLYAAEGWWHADEKGKGKGLILLLGVLLSDWVFFTDTFIE